MGWTRGWPPQVAAICSVGLLLSFAFELGGAILWVTGRQEEAIRACQQAAEQLDSSGGYGSDAHYAALRTAYLLRETDRSGWSTEKRSPRP